MNKYIISTICMAIVLLSFSCSDDDYYESPNAAFDVIDKDGTVITGDVKISAVLDKLIINNKGVGNYFSVYTGDEGHVYALRDSGDTGLSMTNAIFEYTYTKVGHYTLTVVATGYDNVTGESTVDTQDLQLEVTDSRNTVERLQINSLYNIQLDGQTPETGDFMIAYPNANNDISVYMWHYSRYFGIELFSLKTYANLSDIEVIPSFTTDSENISVFVNDDIVVSGETVVNHLNTNSSDLVPVNYNIIAASGEQNDYVVALMMLPDFASFSMNDVSALGEADLLGRGDLVTSISANQFAHYTTTVTLPQGTDVTALVSTYTNYQDEVVVTVDGVVQISGSTANDFTQPVTYTLTRKMPGFEERFISTTTVTVTVEIQ